MSKTSEKAKKTRFNIIDVIVILAILAVVAAIILIVVNQSGTQEQSKSVVVRYTIRFDKIPKEDVFAIAVGADVRNAAKTVVGSVSAIRTEPTKYYNNQNLIKGENGYELTRSEYADYTDVYVTVISNATLGENDIAYVEQAKILVGSYMGDISIGSFASSGYIIAFEIIGE